MNKKQNNKASIRFPKFVWVFLGILAFSLIVYVISLLSPEFSDFFNAYPAAAIRAILAWVTYIFPFSIAEVMIILLPAFLILLGILAYKKYCKTWRDAIVFTVSLLASVSLFFSSFILAFGCGYHGSTLDKKLGLDKKAVSVEELEDTALWLAQETNALSSQIEFAEDGSSIMPYSISDMNKKLMDAYDKVCDEYSFIQRLYSRAKPVMLSEAMSYTHITGVYTYFTGEANINVHFPDYTIPYTAAHELAHQRGIAREDEANFVAFLVCAASDDPYIRYSGYLNLYEYLASPLHSHTDAYKRVYSTLLSPVIGEMRAYSVFFNQYRDSTAGKVSEKVNDTFLQVQGTVGTKSYGMVVDLAVAYRKTQIS